VDGISFAVPRGQIVGLLGGNGAGKTTTIACVMGLVTPTSGEVTVLGAEMPAARHAVLHRMNFESPYVDLPGRLTVRQNLNVFARLYGVPQPATRIAELAESLDLVALLDRPSGTLSSGQKTRVALAKALINRPELLLLDEPTASLDPDTADWIRGRIAEQRTRHGVSILLASHNMLEVERLCDHVLMMRRGVIVDTGSPAELIGRYGRTSMEEVFLDIARGRTGAGAVP
jgi:ABC-2 type transport system ATP-binding protein